LTGLLKTSAGTDKGWTSDNPTKTQELEHSIVEDLQISGIRARNLMPISSEWVSKQISE
jgi:hypothetical protein